MATISEAKVIALSDSISQGDIFENVQYISIQDETNDYVDISEYTYPVSIVLSQNCDVFWMNDLKQQKSGSISKVMPMVLMCPFFQSETIKKGSHLQQFLRNEQLSIKSEATNMFVTNDRNIAQQDLHYRYHDFNVKIKDKTIYANYVLDFKQCFTVPFTYLDMHRSNRKISLAPNYAQQVTLKFCSFLSRIGFE